MLKLVYALHKLRVKHATQQAIHLEDSLAATRRISTAKMAVAQHMPNGGHGPPYREKETVKRLQIK